MSKPRKSDLMKLKRVARYLKFRPTLTTVFPWQAACHKVTVYTDSDWAGDRVTRKSTSGGVVMVGMHALKTWGKDQSVVAMSSGEAELYAANYGAAQALGMQSG